MRQGEVGDSFFIIEEGKVKCTQLKASGREVDLITLQAVSILVLRSHSVCTVVYVWYLLC